MPSTQADQYVLIIGSSNMDLNVYLERLPTPGETVTGGTFEQFLGGKGANQAVASARSGSKTIFIAKIGCDNFGDIMITQLISEGINTEYIIRDSDEKSGVAFIFIEKNGENMIGVAPGANFKFNVKEIRNHEALIKNANVIIVQMEIPIDTIREIFAIGSEGRGTKILNPAPLKPIPSEILQNVDIIVPNEGELFRLHSFLGCLKIPESSDNRILLASKDISEFGVKNVITTLGKKGCHVFQSSGEKSTLIPAFPVEAVDTVGAGDCFNGVLASKLNQGYELIESVLYASAAASIAVTRKGAQDSMPYEDEIIKRYSELKKLTINEKI